MNKKLLVVSCLFLNVSAFAGDHLLTLPGSIWGSFDYKTNSSSKLDLGLGRGQGNIEQGVELSDFPHLTAYGALTVYEPVHNTKEEYLSVGLKNKTLLRPFQFGIERRYPQYISQYPTRAGEYVVFISVWKEWNLLP